MLHPRLYLPTVGVFNAVICGKGKERNALIVNGYVRCCFAENERIPQEIICMIMTWCSVEYAYLMEKKGKLWKMDLNDILYPAINNL